MWVFGVLLTVTLFGNQTGGHFSVHNDLLLPGRGAIPHYHTREDEYWYVAEGRVTMFRGDEVFDAEQGSLLHLPRNVPHWMQNDHDTPARIVITYAPAGFEEWFMKIGEPTKEGDTPFTPHPPPTPESLSRAAQIGEAEFGVRFLPPASPVGAETIQDEL